MRPQFKKTAMAAAIALLGTTAAQASIIGTLDPLGSEWLLNVVNTSTSASVSQDLGIQENAGGNLNISLDPVVSSFITSAGGISGVTFSVIGGNGASFDFVTTASKSTFSTLNISNSTKTNWNGALNGLIAGLSTGDASPASANNAYGPYNAGNSPNYNASNYYRWGTTSNSPDIRNLVSTASTENLYLVNFDQNASLGNAVISSLGSATLSGTSLNLQVVPVPAAVWLFGSALGLLGIRRRQA